jgi:hypothetical protein
MVAMKSHYYGGTYHGRAEPVLQAVVVLMSDIACGSANSWGGNTDQSAYVVLIGIHFMNDNFRRMRPYFSYLLCDSWPYRS